METLTQAVSPAPMDANFIPWAVWTLVVLLVLGVGIKVWTQRADRAARSERSRRRMARRRTRLQADLAAYTGMGAMTPAQREQLERAITAPVYRVATPDGAQHSQTER